MEYFSRRSYHMNVESYPNKQMFGLITSWPNSVGSVKYLR